MPSCKTRSGGVEGAGGGDEGGVRGEGWNGGDGGWWMLPEPPRPPSGSNESDKSTASALETSNNFKALSRPSAAVEPFVLRCSGASSGKWNETARRLETPARCTERMKM